MFPFPGWYSYMLQCWKPNSNHSYEYFGKHGFNSVAVIKGYMHENERRKFMADTEKRLKRKVMKKAKQWNKKGIRLYGPNEDTVLWCKIQYTPKGDKI